MTAKTVANALKGHTPNGSKRTRVIRSRRHDDNEIEFLTIAQVAEFISVSERTVRRWIKSGELVAHHFGTAVRIAESNFKVFVTRHRDP